MGKPVQIFSKNEEGNLELNKDELARVLLHPDADGKPFCLLSVAGAFRLGKSFLLNFLVRYVKNKGHQNNDWLGNREAKLDDGFSWRGGVRRHTIGIHIWDEPFIIEESGRQVAVFLLDTQGSHDLKAGKEECVKVFAVSLLLSSVMVFNISGQIQDDDLDYLQFCAEYCKAAIDGGAERRIFQKLLFLVRDWSNLSDYEYGLEQGGKYLSDMILNNDPTNKTATLQRMKDHLTSSFDKIECYLMPHPGDKVAKTQKFQSFDGKLKDIDEEFLAHVSQLATHLLHPLNLVTKGSYSACGLLKFISRISNDITKSKEGKLPLPTTVLESTAEAHAVDTFLECVGQYNDQMEQVLSKGFISWDTLETVEKKVYDAALGKLRGKITFGGTERVKNIEDKLKGLLVEARKRAEMKNKLLEKMNMESLEQLLAAYIADYRKDMLKGTEAADSNELSSLLLRMHRKLKDTLGKLFQAAAKEILGIDPNTKMKKFNEEIEDAFILVEVEAANRLKRTDIKLLKLICDSADIYHAECSDKDAATSTKLALKYFDENAPDGASSIMLRKNKEKLVRLLQKDQSELNRELLVAKTELSLLFCKERCTERAYNVIISTEEYFCDEDELKERLKDAKKKFLDEFAAEESRHNLANDARDHKIKDKLELHIEKCFEYVSRRNKRYLDRVRAKLDVDSLNAEIEYSKQLERELNGFYILPAALDDVHKNVLIHVMPREVPGVGEVLLKQHNASVSIALESTFKRFQKWNDENKAFFTQITHHMSEGIIKFSGTVVGGVSSAISAAETAGISTALMLPIAGGALLGAVTILAVGAAVSYTKRMKGIKGHFEQDTKRLEKKLKSLTEDN